MQRPQDTAAPSQFDTRPEPPRPLRLGLVGCGYQGAQLATAAAGRRVLELLEAVVVAGRKGTAVKLPLGEESEDIGEDIKADYPT